MLTARYKYTEAPRTAAQTPGNAWLPSEQLINSEVPASHG